MELGVGAGRLAEMLVKAGISVTGLEISVPMLAMARSRLAAFGGMFCGVSGDFRCFDLSKKFPWILCCFNSLQHAWTRRDFLSVLGCVRKHLAADGRFVFDISHPDEQSLARESGQWMVRERFFDERDGQVCEVWENMQWDSRRRRRFSTWEYRWSDGRKEQETVVHRLYSADEIRLLLKRGGFHVESHFGNFEGSPVSPVSVRQVVVCR